MDPGHDGITVTRPGQSQSLAPNLPLLLLQLLQLLVFGLSTALGELPLSRDPSLLPGLVDKLDAVLLEDGHGEEGELVILGQFCRAAGHNHGGNGFVRLEVIFYEHVGDGEEVLLQVLGGVGSEQFAGVDYAGQTALGEVAGARALGGG